MNTEELKKKFDLVQITLFKTKTPLTYWFHGDKEQYMDRVLEVIDGIEKKDFDIWESLYNGGWRTFIKLYPDTKLKPNSIKYEEYNEPFDEEYYEDGLELTMTEAYEYDGPSDGFDDWLVGNGYR